MRRIPFVLALLLGCTSLHAADELELEDPEPAPSEWIAVPDAAPDSRADPSDPCAGATGHVAALCDAEGFDEGCVGLSCARTASRTAVECMLEAGVADEQFIALTRAKNPMTRAYARSALLRRGALDDALIEAAAADHAMVELRGGCIVDRARGSEIATVARSLPRDSDAPFDYVVDRWTRAYGCRTAYEKWEDEWPAERERLLELEAKMRARALELEAELRAKQ